MATDLTLRLTKGSQLTAQELDDNFTALDSSITNSVITAGTAQGQVAAWDSDNSIWAETPRMLVDSNGLYVNSYYQMVSADQQASSFVGILSPDSVSSNPSYGDQVRFNATGSLGPTAPGAGDGFVDYADAVVGELGVAEKFTATSVNDIGTAIVTVVTGGSGNLSYTSAGFLGPPQTAMLGWDAANLTSLFDNPAVNGITIQYEIENSVFDTTTVVDPSASASEIMTLLYVVSNNPSLPNVWYVDTLAATASKFALTINGAGSTDKIETSNIASDALGTHSVVTFTVHGSSSATPYRICVYRNKSLILQNDLGGADQLDPAGIFLGGNAGAGFFPLNPTGRIRNVMVIAKHTIPKRNIRIAVIGDSNISGGQYQAASSAIHTDNNPPLHAPTGYTTGVSPAEGTVGNPNYFYLRDESTFAFMEYYLANKQLYPILMEDQLGISSYGLAGCSIGNIVQGTGPDDLSTGIFERVDAMLGTDLSGQTANLGPNSVTGSNLDLDVVVINLLGNDALYWDTTNTPKPDNYTDLLMQRYRNAIDSIVKISNPRVIVVTTYMPATAENAFVTKVRELNAQVRLLEGYAGVTRVADVAPKINRATSFPTGDGVHYNEIGCQVLAQEIVRAIDIAVSPTIISPGDTAIYSGADWLVSAASPSRFGKYGPILKRYDNAEILALTGMEIGETVFMTQSNSQMVYTGSGAYNGWNPSDNTLAFGFLSADTTLDVFDDIILVTAPSAVTTISLPSCFLVSGKQYTIKKNDASANAIVIDPLGAQTIDGAATKTLSSYRDSITIVSVFFEWSVIAET